MFPSTGKKRSGAGFENPEPSSPKVTCIGQVRVKSKKKHAKRLRSLSRRHSSGAGDASFRRIDHSRDGFSKSRSLAGSFQHGCDSFGSSSNQENQNPQRNNNNPRWVHLPLTICEALRAFGSEFSCLFPCRPSCFSPATAPEKEKSGGGDHRRESGSCAAVFTRWLVAFQDGGDGGGGGGRRDIELVVGDDDDDNDDDGDGEIRCLETSRRHVFDDLEIVNDRIEGGFKDESRLSICIPPKNALLLMRCRSDPLKMEALANRLWEPTVDDDDDEEEEDQEFFDGQDQMPLKKFESFHQEMILNQENQETHKGNQEIQETHKGNQQIQETHEGNQGNQETHQGNQEIQETHKGNQENYQESTFFGSLFDEMVEEIQENGMESNVEKVKDFEEEEMVVTRFGNGSEMVDESKEREAAGVLERESLPECLLLMMCEPKLSMEVSKETWVSSKDFIRRNSSRKKPPPPPPQPPPAAAVEPATGQHESNPKVSATTITTTTIASSNKYHNTRMTAEAAASAAAAATAGVQPGRSSCSLPAPPSMAEMLEQKLVNAVGYEPFVLTRCKSEPMRTAAAKLAPDSCFWKNRKLEPLRRASFGVGAAGVGF
ncbi:hypothetical protein OSB04_015487 [Centaurea solstitialis]|uniref:Uncharacterized protein n=1 Tax=Centaurea solstitialis TaxID=347529 RepID=A0AA38THE7_9ASTR|nr:hypothetical protein OSB04_015487 [Centaurea solstitialis]